MKIVPQVAEKSGLTICEELTKEFDVETLEQLWEVLSKNTTVVCFIACKNENDGKHFQIFHPTDY